MNKGAGVMMLVKMVMMVVVMLTTKFFPKVSNGVEQGSRRQRGAAGKSSSKWSTHRGTGRLILMVIRNN